MKVYKKFWLTTLAILFVASSYIGFLPARTSAITAPFNSSNLMDNFVFEDTSTMSADQINAFLNSQSRSCISPNNGFVTPDPTGWSSTVTTNHGYTFGGNVSAGQAIFDAARIYHVNPQVILATMQKEQSVVTGSAGCHQTNPSPGMACTFAGGGCVFIAMSYACPGTCDSSYNGFSLQLIAGTWLLRFAEERSQGILTNYIGQDPGDSNIYYSGPMTSGERQRSSADSNHFYDGSYTTNDGTSVTITTGATAALYEYTPFISGNRNFDTFFNQYFGSQYANDTLTPHPNGALISYNGRVYLIRNSSLIWITNGDIFNSYGYQWSQVKPASTGDTSLVINTATISSLAPGTLASDGDGHVYLIVSSGGTVTKQWISSATFASMGYSWSQILNVSSGSLPNTTAPGFYTSQEHPGGTVVSSAGSVYYIDPSTNTKDYVSAIAFETNDYQWKDVVSATDGDTALATGTAIAIQQGAMLISSGNIYVVAQDSSGTLKEPLGPWECYANRLHYTDSDWYNVSISSLPTRTGSLFTC